MMRPKVLILSILLAVPLSQIECRLGGFSTPAFAQEAAANVAGEWEVTMDVGTGAAPVGVLTLEQEGADLKGIMSSEVGELAVTGEVEGNEVTFSGSFDAQGFPVTIYFTATVVEEDNTLKMAGTLEIPDFPEAPIIDFQAVKAESLSIR